MPRILELPDLDDTIRRYLAGASVKQLADELHVSRGMIGPPASGLTRALIRAGVHMRSRSDQERIRWALLKLDPAAVERQCGAAWAAVRGSTKTDAAACKHATGHQINGYWKNVGFGETEILRALALANIHPVPQYAFGRYNFDLALEPERIAVEIHRGHIQTTGRAGFRKRVKEILDAGWLLVFVPAVRSGTGTRRDNIRFDPIAVAEQIIALRDLARRDPAAVRGRYRVIRRNGDAIAMHSQDLDGFPEVPHSGNQFNPTLHD
jgi:hypothetical protein